MSKNKAAQLPTGWDETTLQGATTVIRGITFPGSAKSQANAPGTVVCLRTSNVQKKLEFEDVLHVPEEYVKRDEQWLQDGDTVISMANSYELVGKVALAVQPPERTTIGGFISIIRPHLLDPRFTHYQIASTRVQEQIRKTASHTVNISNLSLRAIHPTKLLVAPLPEQHRIVEALESYFTRLNDAVATLERVQRSLKRYRASVLKAALEGRLVPTEAELARAEGCDYEPASVLLERILAERRRRWEEAELAKMKAKGKPPKNDKWKANYKEPAAIDAASLSSLPEGWVYCTIPMIVEPTNAGMKTGPFGSLLKKHEHCPSGVPVLGIENIEPMRFVPGSKIHISPEKAAQLSNYDVVPGDVLVSRSGTVGEVCVAPDGLGESRFSTNVMRVRLMSARPLASFLTLALNGSPFVRGQVSELCKGTTRDFLNQSILSQLILPIPPVAEQHRVLTEVERQLSVADVMESDAVQDQSRLSQLRQSILKWAFEGRLVDQDPTDEPASRLIERIQAEREEPTQPPRIRPRARATTKDRP